jgi:hypothetical protein
VEEPSSLAEAVVFERLVSPARERLHVLLGLLCWAPGPVTALGHALGWWTVLVPLRDFAKLAGGGLAGTITSWSVLGLVALSPILLQMVTLTYLRGRFARASLSRGGLEFEFALDTKTETISVDRIDERRLTRDAVILTAHGRSRVDTLFYPLVIPTRDEAEQHSVLQLLDAWEDPRESSDSSGR